MNIADKLNEYITNHQIKQTYIAQKTGLTIETVSNILNGSRRIPADEFLLICTALDIDPNIFRNGTA